MLAYDDAPLMLNQTFAEAPPSAPDWGEMFMHSWEAGRKASNFDAHLKNYSDAFDAIQGRVKAATNEDLVNPFTIVSPGQSIEMLGTFSREGVEASSPVVAWRQRVRELAEKHPKALDWKALEEEPGRVAWESYRKAMEASQRASQGAGLLGAHDIPVLGAIPVAGPLVGGVVAFGVNALRHPFYTLEQVAGSFAASMTSPADFAVNAIGFGVGGAAKSIVKNAMLNAAANAAGQALLSGPKQISHKSAGLPYGANVWAEEVAGAAATGFAIDAMLRGAIGRPLFKALGVAPDTPRGTFFRDAPPSGGGGGVGGGGGALGRGLPEATQALANKAAEGDIGAVQELARQTGLSDEPAVKGALNALEIEGGVDPLEALRTELRRQGIELDDGSLQRGVLQGLRAAIDEQEPLPVNGAGILDRNRVPNLANDAELISTIGTNQHAQQVALGDRAAVVRQVDMATAKLADLGDAGERLAGRPYSPEAAGRLLIHERRDGTLDVVDGKARAALARAAGQAADAVIFREDAGWSRAEVERLAEAKALREGGTGLREAAAALRRDPELGSVLLGETDFDHAARALAALSDEAWRKVEAGTVDPQIAAMVAEHAEPGLHAGLLDALARAGITDIDEARRSLLDLGPVPGRDAPALLLGLDERVEGDIKAGADVDEPGGAAAKKQTERLAQDLAPEIEQAKALAGEAAKTRDLITGLRRDIASLERHIDRAEAGRYVDPETGAAVPRRVVDAMIDLWKGVRDWRANGRKPMRLAEFVRQHGGLKDEGGDVRQIIDRPRDRPGLLNNRSGSNLDDMALMAWERGYFEGSERPTIAEFLDRLDDDVRGNAVYSHLDREAVDDARLMDEAEQELGRRGLRDARSRGEIAAYYQRQGAEGTAGDQIAALRDQLAAKEQDLARAEDALRLFERGGAGDQGLADAGVVPFAIRSTQLEARQTLDDGRAHVVDDRLVAVALQTLLPHLHMVPEDVNVGVLVKAEVDARWTLTGVTDPRSLLLTFRRIDGSEFHIERLPMYIVGGEDGSAVGGSKALRVGGTVTSDGRPALAFLHFGDYPERTLSSEIWHELGHELRDRNTLSGLTWRRLLNHAEKLRIMEWPASEIFRLAHDPNWANTPYDVKIKDLYHERYAVLAGIKGRRLTEYMNQEAVTHMLEMIQRGDLKPHEIEPIRDIIEWIASGEAAGRPGGEAAQWGHIDAATGKAMWSAFNDSEGGPQTALSAPPLTALAKRQPDIDALGYYSKALEAARSLKQAKGTPEQMLAQLKNAGVKDAEIEATGLKGLLDGKTSVTRDEIIAHLEGNRIGLREVNYGGRADLNKSTRDVDATSDALGQALNDSGIPEARINELLEEIGYLSDTPGTRLPDEPEYRRDPNLRRLAQAALDAASGTPEDFLARAPKWAGYSLDPSNPTYSETVLHLPEAQDGPQIVPHPKGGFAIRNPSGEFMASGGRDLRWPSREEAAEELSEAEGFQPGRLDRHNFRSGHFPEPNIIGHMMTSLTTLPPRVVKDADGNMLQSGLVYTIDQIQSDWGQKLRDGGVRDEAKIAELEKRLLDARKEYDARAAKTNARFDELGLAPSKEVSESARAFDRMEKFDRALKHAQRDGDSAEIGNLIGLADEVEQLGFALMRAAGPMDLISAELRTAKASAPGHPLVNTTDQWVNTTLRRAIRQAVEAGADYIAIPHGDTVLSYNPGDTKGMRGFYGSRETEGIVPKNLRKLLKAIDKDSPDPQRIDKLMTTKGAERWQGELSGSFHGEPSQTGFTLFPITEKVALSVMRDGQPMFSLTAPPRSPERAGQVLDRAARMRRYRAGSALRNLVDPQMKPVNLIREEPFDMLNVRAKARYEAEVPLNRVYTIQDAVSLRSAKAKIGDPTSDMGPVYLFKWGEDYYVNDGNHRVMAARAQNKPTVLAKVVELEDLRSPAARPADAAAQPVGAQDADPQLPLTLPERRNLSPIHDALMAERERAVTEPRETEPRLPLDDAQQETAGRIMALANRILQRPDGGAERAVTERDAGNGLVNRVMVGEQAFEVDRAPDGTVAGLREVTPETTETLAALVKEIGGRAGIEMDDAMALGAANRILDVMRNLSANAGEPMARMAELLQEMMTPPEPAKPVSTAPTPLARDLAEIDRIGEIGAVAKACRA